jgi:hypothetical protein
MHRPGPDPTLLGEFCFIDNTNTNYSMHIYRWRRLPFSTLYCLGLESVSIQDFHSLHSILSHQGFRDPSVNIITKCARIKFYTYDDSWYRNECHIINIYNEVLYKIVK